MEAEEQKKEKKRCYNCGKNIKESGKYENLCTSCEELFLRYSYQKTTSNFKE